MSPGHGCVPAPEDRYRVVVMGAAGVGKTALIRRFLDDAFAPGYRATIEELHRRELPTPEGRALVLEVLDTAGAYHFPAMRALSIARADAFALVFAVDDEASFDEVRSLREQVLRGRQGAPVVVVGNKSDSEGRRVPREAAESTACIDWELGYVETSARDGVNVDAAFAALLPPGDLPALLDQRRRSLPPPTRKPGILKRHGSCVVS